MLGALHLQNVQKKKLNSDPFCWSILSLCYIADVLVERGSIWEQTNCIQFLPVLEGLVGCILAPITDKLGIIILLYLYIV